jgi:hypothetical protein
LSKAKEVIERQVAKTPRSERREKKVSYGFARMTRIRNQLHSIGLPTSVFGHSSKFAVPSKVLNMAGSLFSFVPNYQR